MVLFSENMVKFSFIIICLTFILNNISLLGQNPKWVDNRPYDTSFYIGIGTSSKTNLDFVQIAKKRALAEIASEISITVDATTSNLMFENNKILKKEYLSVIKTNTTAELEGYELVDEWEDENYYLVYYKLNKQYYKNLIKSKKLNAINKSLDFFEKANKYAFDHDIVNSIKYYFLSIKPIQDYFTEPILVDYKNRSFFLENEILNSLTKLLSNIYIKPEKKEYNYLFHHLRNEEIIVNVMYSKDSGIEGIPVLFDYSIESQNNVERHYTNDQGKTSFILPNMINYLKYYRIKITPDIKQFIDENLTNQHLAKALFTYLKIPSTEIKISISPLKVYLDCNQTTNQDQIFCQKITSTFSANGFKLVNSEDQADYYIKLSYNIMDGHELFGLLSIFLDVRISILDNNNNKVYSNSLTDITGQGVDRKNAILNAIKNSSDEIKNEINFFFKNKK
jgi:hypothetical protein